MLAQNRQPLRDLINRYKNSVGWTEGMEAARAVGSSATSYDIGSHHPTITTHAVPGSIEISGKQPGFDSVNIQMRLEGVSDWTTIGVKLNHFPLMDTAAPQVAGKTGKREYRALGMTGDEQARHAKGLTKRRWN